MVQKKAISESNNFTLNLGNEMFINNYITVAHVLPRDVTTTDEG